MNLQGKVLGLSICKRIVEQMGGNVSVTSKFGHGSTFSVFIKAKIKISKVLIKPKHI